ncbi:MAG: diacylglycerol kinase family lipid kinase [Pedobacter sp.]|nr:MAG: diacylglycerol kinase family lipid kinase [Pedobacter sp.]
MKFKTLFIINPISGGKSKEHLPEQILHTLDVQKFDPNFVFTNRVGHAAELTEQAIRENYQLVVGVGGDGTLNEIASKLVHAEIPLGIIPLGSGNGLARDLQVPMNFKQAVECINRFQVECIDVLKLNERFFFNMAGMGYDALISEAFKYSRKRGFWEYLKLCIQKFRDFEPETYRLELDGKLVEQRAFLVSIANSSQYGNNIYISPNSSLRDGQMEIITVEPLNWRELVLLGILMAIKRTQKFPKWKAISAQEVKIFRQTDGPIHLDGEPLRMAGTLHIQLFSQALQVVGGKEI